MSRRSTLWQRVGVALVCVLLCLALRLRLRPAIAVARNDVHSIVGSYHVHSDRSHDSRVAVHTYAQAARKLGLDYLILTDHNVAPQPPQMVAGVLVLFEQEQSTPWGHQVVVHGRSVVAHPTDVRRPWVGAWPQGAGVEIATISSAARRAGGLYLLGLLPMLLAYPIHPTQATWPLYDRNDGALALWDQMPKAQAGLCGVDAHGWLPVAHNLDLWHMVLTDSHLTRPLTVDQAPSVAQALMAGRVFCAAGVLGRAPTLRLHALGHDGRVLAGAGDLAPGDAVHHLAIGHDVGQGTLVIYRNGHVIARTQDACWQDTKPLLGRYRAEVHFDAPQMFGAKRPIPLMYSNTLTVAQTTP